MKRNKLPLKPGLLNRTRINNILTRGLQNSLVTVIAGPGYGKTQAVASFAKATKHRLVWLGLHSMDNPPRRFWANLVRAFEAEMPELFHLLSQMDFPGTSLEFDTFIEIFSNELYHGRQVVFVLDNYNLITNQEIRLFVENLISLDCENLCLILISNNKADLRIGKTNSSFGFFTITSEDIRFTAEELNEYLQMYDTDYTQHDIDLLLNGTEGWPMAIHLANMRYQHEKELTPDTPFHLPHISDFFESEYFANQKKELQKLLVRFSLIPDISLEIFAEMYDDTYSHLTEKVLQNPFVLYDDRIVLIHKMYRDFLRSKSYLLTDAEINRLYRTAGNWYLKKQKTLEAINCYWNCRDYDLMVNAIMSVVGAYREVAWSNQILDYLNMLPRDYINTHPKVTFCMGFMYLNSREVKKALKCLLEARNRFYETEGHDDEIHYLLGETYLALADISLLLNNSDFLDYYKKASEYISNTRIMSRSLLRVNNNAVFFLPSKEPGALNHILETVNNAIVYVEMVHTGRGYGIEWLFAAEAALNTMNLTHAEERCIQAIFKAMEKEQHDIVCNAYFILAQLSIIRGDYKGTMRNLSQISEYLKDKPYVFLDELNDCVWSWFYCIVGDADKSPRWVKNNDLAYLHTYPVGAGRNILIQAVYHLHKRQYQETLTVLSELDIILNQVGQWQIRLKCAILRAICFYSLGDEEKAFKFLWDAYDMSWQNDITEPFAEWGSLILPLLDLAGNTDNFVFNSNWLEKVSSSAAHYAKQLFLVQSQYLHQLKTKPKPAGARLTERETTVLDYIAKGKTREQIAASMEITIHGVKKHITSIYTKLGAINKADAVHIATIQGILPGYTLVE